MYSSTAEVRKGEKRHGVKSAGCYSHATPRIPLGFCMCFCGCGKFTSASIGERLHPRHASSLSGQERDGERKDGERVGGAGRGACKRGQRLGRLIWVGGSPLNWGVVAVVRGGNTLSFHAAPTPTPPPPQPCPSLSLFFSPSLTLGVCLPAVSMATRWLCCCC